MKWLAALAAAFLVPSAACAATIVGTFSGSIFSGTDGAGLFGAAGGDLAGAPFEFTVTYEGSPLSPAAGTFAASSLDVPAPTFSVDFSINGVHRATSEIKTFSIGGAVVTNPDTNAIEFFAAGAYAAAPIGFSVNEQVVSPYLTPYGFTNTGGVYSGNAPSYYCYDLNICGEFFFPGGTRGLLATSSFSISGLQVTPAPTPEPAVWTLAIIGFGLTGGGLRQQRSRIRGAPTS